MEWVDQNCSTCKFNIRGKCRKNPPSIYRKSVRKEIDCHYSYPEVLDETDACSHWRDREVIENVSISSKDIDMGEPYPSETTEEYKKRCRHWQRNFCKNICGFSEDQLKEMFPDLENNE